MKDIISYSARQGINNYKSFAGIMVTPTHTPDFLAEVLRGFKDLTFFMSLRVL
jgi:hypothetical protein